MSNRSLAYAQPNGSYGGFAEWNDIAPKYTDQKFPLGEAVVHEQVVDAVSYPVERLYSRSHSSRQIGPKAQRRSWTYVIFLGAPTIAFSFSILGAIIMAWALTNFQPLYFVPGAMAALGFGVLGIVTARIKRLIQRPNSVGVAAYFERWEKYQ